MRTNKFGNRLKKLIIVDNDPAESSARYKAIARCIGYSKKDVWGFEDGYCDDLNLVQIKKITETLNCPELTDELFSDLQNDRISTLAEAAEEWEIETKLIFKVFKSWLKKRIK